MSKRWYAVQAFSGYEKVVQKRLIDKVSQSELTDDLEIFWFLLRKWLK